MADYFSACRSSELLEMTARESYTQCPSYRNRDGIDPSQARKLLSHVWHP
jgi:hypothetical protein